MMMYDDEWTEDVRMHRLEAIRKSIHPVSLEELTKLGHERFPVVTDPWFEQYKEMIEERQRAHFHMAKFYVEDADEYVEVIYSEETNSGMWFLPGKGMGVLQPHELDDMKAIVEGEGF